MDYNILIIYTIFYMYIFWFSHSSVRINWIYLHFALMVRQNKHIFSHFSDFIDQTIHQDTKRRPGRLMDHGK